MAASILHSKGKEVEAPLYFLYTHTIELCLKAFLNIYSPNHRLTHSLEDLLEESISSGLAVSRNTMNGIKMLKSENEKQGFRYFYFNPTCRPEIKYLAEITEEILNVTAKHIEKTQAKELSKKIILKISLSGPQKIDPDK